MKRQNEHVLRKIIILAPLAIILSGCSYVYGVTAVVRDGRVVFIVDPKSSNAPSCLRLIEVSAEGEKSSVWRDSVDYDDDCANKFPVPYGERLKGRHQQEWPIIEAKPLRRGIIYEVSTTTGATGYGGGRFMINAIGRVENMSVTDEAAQANQTTAKQ